MAAASKGARESTTRRDGELLIGRLAAHGRANYQFRTTEEPSYYLKLLTSRGERTLWGKDLERALTEAETRPKAGDLVGARRASREAVTITTKERDAMGHVVSQAERQAHRTHWVVEKVQFFAERARMARRLRDEQADVRESVRAHPELRSAFLSVRAAEEFANQRIANEADRTKFLDLVKGAIAGSIKQGEPLPSVRLRSEPKRQVTRTAKRDEPTR
ncbi:MAG TPA: hypothetical protein VFS23_04165 [Vicinamibacterales bacterium]|nr:hypothetical protein [Vicinamibacterales bacterium]